MVTWQAIYQRAKSEYIRQRTGELQPGIHKVKLRCELCGKPLRYELEVFRTGYIKIMRGEGQFHHKDGNRENNNPDNLILLCERCHRMLHLWAEVQKWLEEIKKTPKDLPNVKNLKPIAKRYGW